ncbi:MAG: RNA polymerase sporulation sigma factor SigH [Lachnospiraceae bacterium]|nr:RNA polymerase sporulation sigma factor SigH [Lachnospiraceae bacterium]
MNINYDTLSDNEIISRINEKDDDAIEFMMQKYGNIVKREVRTVYIIGAETDDLMQEGMIGLFKAIRDYEADKGTAFSTFATLCIRRQLQTAINNSNRKKHIPLNSYISIYSENGEYGYEFGDNIETENSDSNPEDMVIAREQKNTMRKRIETELSPLEKKVLKLYLDGFSYQEIADRLDKSEKSVDNALQRIRKKLSN